MPRRVLRKLLDILAGPKGTIPPGETVGNAPLPEEAGEDRRDNREPLPPEAARPPETPRTRVQDSDPRQPPAEAPESRQPATGASRPADRDDDGGKQPRRPRKPRSRDHRPGRDRADTPESRAESPGKTRAAVVDLPDMTGWAPPPAPLPQSPEEVSFQDLDLHPRILRALLDDLHFRVCTPIQAMALPFTLDDADLAGQAQTGTGKTAAFLVTIFQRMLAEPPAPREPHQPYALILAPTRELADQIDRDAHAIGAYCGIHSLAVFGGVTYDGQREGIARGLDLVSATPGRLIDYLRQDTIDLSRIRVLVIDEADRMLDMGFIPDVKRIVARVPPPHAGKPCCSAPPCRRTSCAWRNAGCDRIR
ncbi:MAG: DEAD/DEAH box helicase [Lentisphaeria bacterium]|nr:DEAD/DEAH box helicase [Lentisphaeria bacterium]